VTDVHLDTATRDLVLSDAGDDLVLVDGLLELAQRVLATLDVRRGEWAFDNRFGLPHDRIFVRAPDLRAIEAELEDMLLGIDGVVSVDPAQSSLDRRTRRLTVTLRLQSAFGELVVANEPPPGEVGALAWVPIIRTTGSACA